MAAVDKPVRTVQYDGEPLLGAYTSIPYQLISDEAGDNGSLLLQEMSQITKFYNIYKEGAEFVLEGTNGDYVPADLRYRVAASLIDKEARFLFAETPDITIKVRGDVKTIPETNKDMITNYNVLVNAVLEANSFASGLLKASKDAFIGKRVACMVNFNEEDGISVTFLNSLQFIYETKLGNINSLTKFVAFVPIVEARNKKDRRIFKKKYTLESGVVYLEESIHDGSGELIQQVIEKTAIELTEIPAVVILNDGLTGDGDGESEIEALAPYEQWYSKLGNADIDSLRKSMNPIKYTVDMEGNSTKDLSTSAGAFWDLQTDQNLGTAVPKVGVLESNMAYSEVLEKSINRIEDVSYLMIDMPNISLEDGRGVINSSKALKAIYWPLIVRCKEKMKVWGPAIRKVVDIIIEGSLEYDNCVGRYIVHSLEPVIYDVDVIQNNPLPEDEIETKQMNLMEVETQVMSKKAFMKTWRGLTDDEVEQELKQIAHERDIIEFAYEAVEPISGGSGDDYESDTTKSDIKKIASESKKKFELSAARQFNNLSRIGE